MAKVVEIATAPIVAALESSASEPPAQLVENELGGRDGYDPQAVADAGLQGGNDALPTTSNILDTLNPVV